MTSSLNSLDRAARERLLFLLREQERRRPVWQPLRGPQRIAYDSLADIVGYGGAAGGGKTDLALGLALTKHQVVAFFRREGPELRGSIERLAAILGTREGLGGNPPIWRNPTPKCRIIEFGSVPNLGDETKHQGRPKDLLVLDEASNFLESQARFLMGWVRTTDPLQHCQTLMCFNPPTTIEGRWIVDFFGPWLDPSHPNPAMPGELRWYGVVDGKDIEVSSPDPFVIVNGTCTYDFEPTDYDAVNIVVPRSRTFIPSRVTDNPHLVESGYISTLQALPEPLRSQMLYGDFAAGMEDDPWQVIPTAWVDAAQERWSRPAKLPPMSGIGVDVARGGRDATIIMRRHDAWWFDDPLVYPGKETPDGPTVAGLTIAATRNSAPQHIDVIGVGASPYDFLVQAKQQVYGINVAEGTHEKDLSGRLGFTNLRSLLWWRMREALDPTNNTGIQLPPNKDLKRDLCTPKWRLEGHRIAVESREDIVKKLGRSADYASALVLAAIQTPNLSLRTHAGTNPNYDPVEFSNRSGRNVAGWDPYASLP